uniref:Uncharacterized protein n=1 Tax=uncultured Alphaproteobacteria bacterium TaxID=91750 RepID=A0A1B0Z243_9PROT|nr:hypothetical protein [uncultured Alphaproteobacteria bacterium]
MSKGAAGKYRWRELGVSDQMMKRIDRLTKKHGYEEQRAGVTFRWPDVDKWSGETGGLEAKIALHAALKRSTDRAVITPGIGDMPMFHSREIGQLLFQFNSFGFAAVNKYLRNLGHRAVNGEAVGMAMNVTMALGLGALAFSIKEGIVKGRFQDGTMPDEPATYVYEAIDRSGLMGWMMPYANAGLKLTARPLADMGFPIEAPSRFAAQRWFQPILGPTFGGALGDLEAMTSHLVAGDLEKTWSKGRLFVPYRNVFYLEALMNAGED